MNRSTWLNCLCGLNIIASTAWAADNPIRLGWETFPRTADPRFAADTDSQNLEDLVHCSLVAADQDGMLEPALAKAWSWLDPRTLQLELQEGVHFSDGTSVTPLDVKATFDSFKGKSAANSSPRAGAFAEVSDIAVVDKNLVVFKLREPDAAFIANLIVGILPQALTQKDALPMDSHLIGCGMFRIKSVNPTGLVLERNPFAAVGSAAKPSRIHIEVVKDERARLEKLKKGELDLLQGGLNRNDAMEIERKSPWLQVISRPGLNTAYLGFNTNDKVLSDVRVRRAMAMAIRRDAIIDSVLHGLAKPAKTLLPPGTAFFSSALPDTPFDPAGAQKLLDEAGFKVDKSSSWRFSLTYKTPTNDTRIAVAKKIADDLKKVGIKVTVQAMEWNRFRDDVDRGNMQLWGLSWIGFKDPDIFRFAFGSESCAPVGGNRGCYKNPALDKILQEGRASTDPAARAKFYALAQELVQKDLPAFFLWHEDALALAAKSLTGYAPSADGRFSALRYASRP